MSIEKIFSFLVPVGKNINNQALINGTEIELNGKLYDMLSDIFHQSENICKIPICFLPSNGGEQTNEL